MKGKCLITGITNGDTYYPTIAAAGTISTILRRHPEVHNLFSIRELNVEGIVPERERLFRFYQNHAFSLSRPLYQNRILVIGNFPDRIACCVPYLLHLQEGRRKTFETFNIGGYIENFLRDFGHGTKENTTIMVGKLTSSLDKQNLQFCIEKGYPIKYLSDVESVFQELLSELRSEVELAPSGRRRNFEEKLLNLESTWKRELEE